MNNDLVGLLASLVPVPQASPGSGGVQPWARRGTASVHLSLALTHIPSR